jgi:GAF domain-containing protein
MADDKGNRELYARLAEELAALLAGEDDFVANAANTAALIFHALPDVRWAGFYLLRGEELVLGPFQGKPACVRLPPGQGVCQASVQRRETVVVPDVREFPGHIACDAAARSEIVVPLLAGGEVLGVLDLDSAAVGRFDEADRTGLEALARVFIENTSGLSGPG